MPVFDIDQIEALLQAAAAAGETLSYAGVLQQLGMRFTRPKMRALCKVLDAIDARAAVAGQPELAALVVRESDRLPGQGWWVGRRDYGGAWAGLEARAYLASVHAAAFAHWGRRS
jgi:hypothetical protein